MEDNVFTSEELQAILECASDPIYMYEDVLVMFRTNLENAEIALFASVIVLRYSLALEEHGHIHDVYLFADECEHICGPTADISLLVDIKKVKIFALLSEHKWARAEKEALCVLEMIKDCDLLVLAEHDVREDLAFAYKKRRKYREAQEQRMIANRLLDLID